MSKLLVLSAPSGCGKTTYAKKIAEEFHSEGKSCVILSSDNYFIRPDGRYAWSKDELFHAHTWTFNKFQNLIIDTDFNNVPILVILDNTSLRFSEFKHYVDLALRSKWEVEIVRLTCSFTDEELFHRNIHSVPLETIHRQREKWESKESMENQISRLKEKYV